MAGNSRRHRDDWLGSVARLVEAPVPIDPRLVPAMPPDGRGLPDVDLDRLVEVTLADLDRHVTGQQPPASPASEP